MPSINRRQFLQFSTAGLGTFLSCSVLSGCHIFRSSTLLSARNDVDGKHWCVAYALDGSEKFRTAVPQRCHDVLQHPALPVTAFVARRPGTHVYLIDSRNGDLLQVLAARKDRHFYGHGLFDNDGTLYLTENDTTEPGRGVLGVYHFANSTLEFAREISTHGIEPHQFVWLPDNNGFAIANGGIRTEAGSRSALDDAVESSLVLMKKNGELISKETLAAGNSIRHVAITNDGILVTAQQYFSSSDQTSNISATILLAIKKPGEALQPFFVDEETATRLKGYSASIAIHHEQRWLAMTAPRGNRLLLWHLDSGERLLDANIPDCAGIAATEEGFIVSSGESSCRTVTRRSGQFKISALSLPVGGWDNHLLLVDQF